MTMTNEEYIKKVLTTESCNFDEIRVRINIISILRLLHVGMGLVTEAAEFMDALKKYIYYGKELDIINLKEELGDISWYQGIGIDELGTSLEEIQIVNIAKLQKRYGITFDQAKAISRDLSAERHILEKDAKNDGVHKIQEEISTTKDMETN